MFKLETEDQDILIVQELDRSCFVYKWNKVPYQYFTAPVTATYDVRFGIPVIRGE